MMVRLVILVLLAVVAPHLDWTAAIGGLFGLTRIAHETTTAESPAPSGAEPINLWVWIGFVLTLPLATFSFLQAIVRLRSNMLNIYALTIYVGADVVAAALLRAADYSIVGGVVWLAIVAGSLIYNLATMQVALRLGG